MAVSIKTNAAVTGRECNKAEIIVNFTSFGALVDHWSTYYIIWFIIWVASDYLHKFSTSFQLQKLQLSCCEVSAYLCLFLDTSPSLYESDFLHRACTDNIEQYDYQVIQCLLQVILQLNQNYKFLVIKRGMQCWNVLPQVLGWHVRFCVYIEVDHVEMFPVQCRITKGQGMTNCNN